MDAMSIILAIGGVIAGLVILQALVALVFGAIARRSVRKFHRQAAERHEAFRKRHGFN